MHTGIGDWLWNRSSQLLDLREFDLGSGHTALSCITHQSLPTYQISFKLEKLFVFFANSILESFEYFFQMSSKLIHIISSYTVSKLGRSFETQCSEQTSVTRVWMTLRLSSAVNVNEQGRLFSTALSSIGPNVSADAGDITVGGLLTSLWRMHNWGYCGSTARLHTDDTSRTCVVRRTYSNYGDRCLQLQVWNSGTAFQLICDQLTLGTFRLRVYVYVNAYANA